MGCKQLGDDEYSIKYINSGAITYSYTVLKNTSYEKIKGFTVDRANMEKCIGN